ncbi:uncharacterized protein K452DRAFT_283710 [Aplosporella prunicola CBS 121167]|uniref:Uncharacterized protein n=1 Tax=Aplosporella prunicola CBS 121167 TaxID=1176127 RepID=A0A6A6BMK1_9PEZI|nr:uncharacterized protein K452DRAFT_283710 [Aplosporella prunicola CBS 121167]KAF2145352.1 hypothetical protein K452DRAFT_283710 [Aplosporella prunicola CBS 121167]
MQPHPANLTPPDEQQQRQGQRLSIPLCHTPASPPALVRWGFRGELVLGLLARCYCDTENCGGGIYCGSHGDG